MAEPALRRMTVDAFLDWAVDQPSGRYELLDGDIVAMAPETVRHAEAKAEAWAALRTAIRAAGLDCAVFPDGMSVRIDRTTLFEPDALVRCGPRLPGDAVEVADPVIVVEVLSPATRRIDSGRKLIGYFRLPSLRHYLILDPERRTLIHHARGEGDLIATAILTEGVLRLDPPGLAVPVETLFPAADDAPVPD
jgi:Uma2 family endonuclease